MEEYEQRLMEAINATDDVTPMDVDTVCELLTNIFIDDPDNFNMYCPLSKTKIEHPEKAMTEFLENVYMDFIKEVKLDGCVYKFDAVTGYGDYFDYKTFNIDYYNHKVYIGDEYF